MRLINTPCLEAPDNPDQEYTNHGGNKAATSDDGTWDALGRQHHPFHGVGKQRVQRAFDNQNKGQTNPQITHGSWSGSLELSYSAAGMSTPVMLRKYWKKSESGDSTMVVSLSPNAVRYACMDR